MESAGRCAGHVLCVIVTLHGICWQLRWSRSLCYCNTTWNLLAGALVMFFVLGKARDITQHGTFCIAGKSCHMYHFCHDKTFVATNTPLSQQKFCHDKHAFVVTKDVFCHGKHTFVATKLLSCQKVYLWELPPMKLW